VAGRARQRDGIPAGRVHRTAPLLGAAAHAGGEAVIGALRRRGRPPEPEAYARRAERYVELLGRSKGALMKAGQILSYVPFGAAVPPENRAVFQAAMARLQADAPPMAPELAADVVREELGAPPEKIFAEFCPRPLAAASIGQVHAARLPDGRAVAVKIQYPGVAEAIIDDLRNAELLAVFFQLLRSVVPGLTRLDPKEIAQEISARIAEELDYRIEAASQQFFASAYRGHPFIAVPEIIPELSTRRVLTQQLAEGLTWDAAVKAGQRLRDAWGEAIYRFAFGSLRRLRAFNADPHPGNYLFRPDGSVAFLDFGCVKQFDAEQVAQMQDVVRAVVRQDAGALWQAFVELGFFAATGGLTPQEVLDWYSGPFEMLLGPQPFQITPEIAARAIANEASPAGRFGRVVRSLSLPADYVFLSRIDLGLFAVLAELRATGDWRGIQAELDDGAPPATPMGEAEAEFWASRPQVAAT
jgi:predicted unusual protein kinase regulating ubiquinone biosynthesis (AarF/ABC1/UbiB family)